MLQFVSPWGMQQEYIILDMATVNQKKCQYLAGNHSLISLQNYQTVPILEAHLLLWYGHFHDLRFLHKPKKLISMYV